MIEREGRRDRGRKKEKEGQRGKRREKKKQQPKNVRLVSRLRVSPMFIPVNEALCAFASGAVDGW